MYISDEGIYLRRSRFYVCYQLQISEGAQCSSHVRFPHCPPLPTIAYRPLLPASNYERSVYCVTTYTQLYNVISDNPYTMGLHLLKLQILEPKRLGQHREITRNFSSRFCGFTHGCIDVSCIPRLECNKFGRKYRKYFTMTYNHTQPTCDFMFQSHVSNEEKEVKEIDIHLISNWGF